MARNSKREAFELDDEPVQVERRARADVVISVRLSRDEADQLQKAAKRANKTLSQTAREAIVGCLSGDVPVSAGSSQWTIASNGGGPVYLKVRGNDEVGAQTAGEGHDLTVEH